MWLGYWFPIRFMVVWVDNWLFDQLRVHSGLIYIFLSCIDCLLHFLLAGIERTIIDTLCSFSTVIMLRGCIYYGWSINCDKCYIVMVDLLDTIIVES